MTNLSPAEKAWKKRKLKYGASGMAVKRSKKPRAKRKKVYAPPSQAEMAQMQKAFNKLAFNCKKCGALNWKQRHSKELQKKFGSNKCIFCGTVN